MSAALGELVRALAPELVGLSHELHDRPELGGEERYAVERLTAIASREGFEVERPLAGLETAFLARRRLGSGRGPRIAMLAEYDALPGLGHGCGHNWIAAVSLGAALTLARLAEGLEGEVLLVGTPGEESFGGKVALSEAGLFAGVDAAMMVHPSRRTLVDRTSLASCPLEVEFRGAAAHAAASPQDGRNALDALVLMMVAVDQLARSLPEDVRLPRVVTAGGEAPNLIPDRAVLRFSLRAARGRTLEHVRQRVEECARGAAIATRTTETIRLYEPRYAELRSSPVLVRLFRAQLARLGLAEDLGEGGRGGSLDMGNVSQLVPALHADLKITEESAHTERFREAAVSPRADEALALAVEALAATGLALLERPELAEEARVALHGPSLQRRAGPPALRRA